MKYVLLTGFEPFGGDDVNPSLEAVTQLEGKNIEGYTVVAKSIPVEFGRSVKELIKMIEVYSPEVVICVGLAGGRSAVSVERIAINVDDARVPDNAGKQPVDERIEPDGPAAYWSTLPIKSIVEKMRMDGVPAIISNTAGTYVCNHIFYGLMHFIATQRPTLRGGFIHVPFTHEQAILHQGQPSMSLEYIAKSLEVAVATSLTTDADIVAAEGTLS